MEEYCLQTLGKKVKSVTPISFSLTNAFSPLLPNVDSINKNNCIYFGDITISIDMQISSVSDFAEVNKSVVASLLHNSIIHYEKRYHYRWETYTGASGSTFIKPILASENHELKDCIFNRYSLSGSVTSYFFFNGFQISF
ncbi:hypothetical protein QWY31_00525 [Cytophagales bacterium LB-30]|uniref:Uncharacterized protein n=1 Tax=Shiella aurantiaca TaxID=3058365 RepID=A0ABT8F0K7_9BACT|nr:hypothetical protein [Shiella aurantiaca]MDN4163960.1 hypothetical protein [Shiella aurantiaca]